MHSGVSKMAQQIKVLAAKPDNLSSVLNLCVLVFLLLLFYNYNFATVKNCNISRAVVAHAYNPSTLGDRGRQISEFEASLVYRVRSRTARVHKEKPCLEKTKTKTKTKKRNWE